MLKEEFENAVIKELKLSPKVDQLSAIALMYDFLFEGGSQSGFILKGYAGTGKTTLVGALIRWLHTMKRKTVLMAPTGRSAKVLSQHSGYSASTIHRKIYSVKQNEQGRISMQLAVNTAKKTIFIVDEASMIGDNSTEEGLSSRSLLQDLIEFVYSGERCRLILIGDDAQLPPVGLDLSPALDPVAMAKIFHGPIFHTTLTEVVRQQQASLILTNATALRKQIGAGDFEQLALKIAHREQVQSLDALQLGEYLESSFGRDDDTDSVIICRSNKDANAFNHQIRTRILQRESEIAAGDRLMIVKNNYFWELPGQRQNFLANGDMITVDRVYAIETYGPFRFARCQVRFSDDSELNFELILLLNSLDVATPNIPTKELFILRESLIESGEIDPMEARERFFKNPYFNAVQVKYAYAVTCHKSQGGQWNEVFIYQGYLTDEMIDRSYYRWLYTAITRATTQVWLVGFHPQFLSEQ